VKIISKHSDFKKTQRFYNFMTIESKQRFICFDKFIKLVFTIFL